jgi:GLPGLI family protein
MKCTYLLSILIICAKFSYAQDLSFIGSVTYSTSQMTATGNYEKKNTIETYFNTDFYSYRTSTTKAENVDNMALALTKKLKKTSDDLPLDSLLFNKIKQDLLAQSKNRAIPHKIINYASGIAIWEAHVGAEAYYVTDTITKIQWELVADTATIHGLPCKKARGFFIGKYFDVWYCNKIALPVGPANMHGLPGIIVSATSMDATLKYTLDDFEYPLAKQPIMMKPTATKAITLQELSILQAQLRKKITDQAKDRKEGTIKTRV